MEGSATPPVRFTVNPGDELCTNGVCVTNPENSEGDVSLTQLGGTSIVGVDGDATDVEIDGIGMRDQVACQPGSTGGVSGTAGSITVGPGCSWHVSNTGTGSGVITVHTPVLTISLPAGSTMAVVTDP